MLKKLLLILLLVVLGYGIPATAAPDFVYVAATNVNIRATPSTSGKVVKMLPIGTWGKVMEKSATRQNLIGKSDYWYKIEAPGNIQGWIFGGLTIPTTEEERFSSGLELLRSRLLMADKPLEEHMQVCEFAETIKDMASHSAEKARLELIFLQTLDQVCSTISQSGTYGEENHKKNSLISKHSNLVYYHESAGQFFVDPKIYWELSEKYTDIPVEADEIAWAAANQQLNGETEGDPWLSLAFYELSKGAYLQKFPSGKFANEALSRGADTLQFVEENLTDDYFNGEHGAESRKDFILALEKLSTAANNCPDSSERKAFLNLTKGLSSKISK